MTSGQLALVLPLTFSLSLQLLFLLVLEVPELLRKASRQYCLRANIIICLPQLSMKSLTASENGIPLCGEHTIQRFVAAREAPELSLIHI